MRSANLALKLVQLACAVVNCIIGAGLVFGFASLKPILAKEGVYSEYCSDAELAREVPMCRRQDAMLNYIFAAAAVAANVAPLVASYCVEKIGPRPTATVGSVILGLGAYILTLGPSFIIDPYTSGYTLLGFSGPFILLASLPLSNLFPRSSGLVLALLFGASDASAGVFAVYHHKTQFHGLTVPTSEFFGYFMAVPVFILITQFFVMPSSYKYPSIGGVARLAENRSQITESDEPTDPNENTRLLNDNGGRDEIDFTYSFQNDTESAATSSHLDQSERPINQLRRKSTLNDVFRDPAAESSGTWGALHDLAASKQMGSPWFVLIVLFTAVQLLVINYFIASVHAQYQYLLRSADLADKVTQYFEAALPLGGIVAIPFIGVILDNVSTLTVFTALTGVSLTIGVLGLIPGTYVAAIVRVTLIVLFRPWYFTAVSDYSAKVFGFDTFGIVYGLVLCLSGLGNFFMVYFDFITLRFFHRSPLPVTIMLTALTGVIGVSFLLYIWNQTNNIRRKQLEDEATHAPVQTMPGATVEPTESGEAVDSTADTHCRTGACDNCVCEV
ncbi:hypothetical protein TRVA0_049S00584 [Trichomonascus vanleenenianus]|uniref:Fmp42p n=1 Tax=Trichomonascus vanleenenianus TaxID=2268995 RepID=UPI003ECA2EE4